MKKLLLIITLGVGVAGTSAFARDYDRDDRSSNRHFALLSHDVGPRVDHLNQMLEHVRGEARQYRIDGRLRRELDHVSSEVERVNSLYRNGFDTLRLSRKIDNVRSELHRVEVRLHARNSDWYRWDR
jgi:hypothetical protein